MGDMQCPYCGADQEVCHDDGAGYSEDTRHEHTCSMDRRDNNTCAEVISREAMRANARLISAAPDMLEVLQRIANWDAHTAEFSMDYGSNGVRDFYRGLALSVISKATGEPSP